MKNKNMRTILNNSNKILKKKKKMARTSRRRERETLFRIQNSEI